MLQGSKKRSNEYSYLSSCTELSDGCFDALQALLMERPQKQKKDFTCFGQTKIMITCARQSADVNETYA